MLKKSFFVVAFGFVLGCTLGHATSAPFCAMGTGACILSGVTVGQSLSQNGAVNSNSMGGTVIAAAIGQTGTVYNEKFTGTLLVPAAKSTARTPEPGSLLLLGSGLLVLAGVMRYRRNH